MAATEAPLVRMTGISKRFETVAANRDVDLDLRAGEVHALLGQNGAGKTTLMNILAGLYRPDAGVILLDGAAASFSSPADALAAGIGMVHQHFRLVDTFTVAENVHLGWSETPRRTTLRALARRTEALAARFGLEVEPYAQIWQLSVGQQQRVEILRALARGSRVLILDEPTAVLTPQESSELFRLVRELAAAGCAVVLISHKLEEVLAVCDRITVLRDGGTVATLPAAGSDRRRLARLMVGEDLTPHATRRRPGGHEVLRLREATAAGDRGVPALLGIDLVLREGELVGVAGVAGNGQRELAEVLTGLRRMQRGTLEVDGAVVTATPARCAAAGIASIPEDRLETGVVGGAAIWQNAVLREYRRAPVCRGPVLRRRRAERFARDLLEEARVAAPSVQMPISRLSGGNVQRLLVAREARIASRALVAANPTRGLDVHATERVRAVLTQLRDRGTAVLLISEDLDELLLMADRLVVMYGGRIVGEFAAEAVDRDRIGLLMAGVAPSGPA